MDKQKNAKNRGYFSCNKRIERNKNEKEDFPYRNTYRTSPGNNGNEPVPLKIHSIDCYNHTTLFTTPLFSVLHCFLQLSTDHEYSTFCALILVGGNMETREMNYESSTLNESVYDTFVPLIVSHRSFVEA